MRLPRPSDRADYERLFQLPEVERWLRPDPLTPFSGAEAHEMLNEDIVHWKQLEYGPWALLEGADERFVGRVGLHRTTVEGATAIELAWTTDPSCQGRGYATVAALAALDLARSAGLEEVVAMTLPENLASRRVAEKLGMAVEGEISHAGLAHVLYRLTLT